MNYDRRSRKIVKVLFLTLSIVILSLSLFYFYLNTVSFSNNYKTCFKRFLKTQTEDCLSDQEEFLKNSVDSFHFSKDSISSGYISVKLSDGNYFHYIESSRFNKFSFITIFLIILVLFLVGIHFVIVRLLNSNERSKVLVAMSREAAHQMGTPLSSIMGWLELLREFGLNSDTKMVYDGLREDLRRLDIVANRFSKIGVIPNFEYCDLKIIIESVVKYLKERSSKSSGIVFNIGVPSINLFGNFTLLSWAFENILKNSVQELSSKNYEGKISVRVTQKNGFITIDFIDNGSGLTDKKRVFESGYTTKKRGWGLGLVLAKRVFEEIHKGKIFVKETSSSGTTIRVVLPES